MKTLYVLVLVLTGILAGSAAGKLTGSLIHARLESQQTRLNSLSERLDYLIGKVKESPEIADVQKKVQELIGRIELKEENDCGSEDYISCGRNSGQCVHHLLVCDNKVDCENGHDEANDTCENIITPGTSIKGYRYFQKCFSRGAGYNENSMTCTWTSNTRDEYLPSLLHFTGMCAWSYQLRGGEMKTETFTYVGTHNYGKRQSIWLPPPERIAVSARLFSICDYIGQDFMICRNYNEADMSLCGISYYSVHKKV